jgi:hypothetical protein
MGNYPQILEFLNLQTNIPHKGYRNEYSVIEMIDYAFVCISQRKYMTFLFYIILFRAKETVNHVTDCSVHVRLLKSPQQAQSLWLSILTTLEVRKHWSCLKGFRIQRGLWSTWAFIHPPHISWLRYAKRACLAPPPTFWRHTQCGLCAHIRHSWLFGTYRVTNRTEAVFSFCAVRGRWCGFYALQCL